MEKKEYTTQLMVNFGEDGKTLLPVVTQDYRTKDSSRKHFISSIIQIKINIQSKECGD